MPKIKTNEKAQRNFDHSGKKALLTALRRPLERIHSRAINNPKMKKKNNETMIETS